MIHIISPGNMSEIPGPDTPVGMDICIFCKGATEPHCESSVCTWRSCGTCESVIWREAKRALHRGISVPWPYGVPDGRDAA